MSALREKVMILVQVQKHEIVTTVWRETITANSLSPSSLKTLNLCMSLTFCTSLTVFMALWPRSSTVSVEQLVSIWSPFGSLCGYAHTHTRTHSPTHTREEWGALLSLAHRSVDGVIESFNQNIGGAVKHLVLAVVTALRLSIRLGWSSCRSA